MVYRVVSTKLTEDEHTTLLDECGRLGLSPFAYVRQSILEKIATTRSALPPDKREDDKSENDLAEVTNAVSNTQETSVRKSEGLMALIRLSRQVKKASRDG